MTSRIRKAVFPVAGLGTRFLPATKAMPKEMLPVVDRPLIQHVVDEAREAGIEHFIFVTGRYILQPEILDLLAKQDRGTGGEIQLTDAMIALSRTQNFYGLKFEGRSFDCGSKIGFLAANVSYALERPDIAPGFRAEIKKILGELNGG